jgi:hypothetical protein
MPESSPGNSAPDMAEPLETRPEPTPRVTVVILNTDAQPHTISLTTPGFVASSSVTLPSHSLVTAVLEGVASE